MRVIKNKMSECITAMIIWKENMLNFYAVGKKSIFTKLQKFTTFFLFIFLI